MPPAMLYRKGYKYQLVGDYTIWLPHVPPRDLITSWIFFDTGGRLILREGYAWDGPSGPTVDTPDSIRGSAVHDAGYQLIRLGLLQEDPWRAWFDELLWDICIEDGMPVLRADIWYRMVRDFAGGAAQAKAERPVLATPRAEPFNLSPRAV